MFSFSVENFAMWPGGVIAWIIVGLISGWAAGQLMKDGGYGMIGDIVVGLIGAMIGGFLLNFVVHGAVGFWGSVVVSVIGACILIMIVRILSRSRT